MTTTAGSTAATTAFRIGEWEVHPDLNRLVRDDAVETLEPRVMAVLLELAARRGEVATRRDLLDAVWSDAVVGEEQLTRTVSELRRLFGDEPRQPRYIETIFKKGYRLLEPVRPLDRIATPPGGSEATQADPRRRTTSRSTLTVAFAAVVAAAIASGSIWFAASRPRTGSPTNDQPVVTPLTSYPGRETQPAISPDGSRIAFSWSGEDPASDLDLWLIQRGGGQPVRLTDLPGGELMAAWSAAGDEIAFAHVAAGLCRILVMPSIGGTPRPLADCVAGMGGFDLTPGGRHLVQSGFVPGHERQGTVVTDLDSGVTSPLAICATEAQRDTTPRVSPDGSSVAFRRRLGEAWYELFVVPLEGGRLVKVTNDGQDNGGFDWAPDGSALIYSSNRGGAFGLWAQAVSGGDPRWLGVEDAYEPSVAAATGDVAVSRRRWDADIWRISSAGDAGPWIASTRADLDPQYSNDGDRVAFVSWRTAGHELWIASSDGADPRRVTFFDRPAPAWRPAVQHPRWAPGDRRIAVAARTGTSFDLFVVGIDGAPPDRWTSHPADDLAPAWSHGGLVFASNRTGAWQLWRTEAGAAPVQLTSEPILPYVETDGAGRPVFSRGVRGLWRIETDGSERRIVDVAMAGGWTVAGDTVAWISGGTVWTVDPDSGDAPRATAFAVQAPAGGTAVADSGLSLSPDRRILLYSRLQSHTSDLHLVRCLP